MKEALIKIREKFYEKVKSKNNYITLICWIIFGLLGTLAIELVQRGSLHEVKNYVLNNTWIYIVNSAFIWAVTLPIFFIRRKGFHYMVVATVLGGFALANKMITVFRGTPLTFSDMYLVKEGLAIANKFLDATLVKIIIIMLLVVVVFLIGVWVLERKRKGFSGTIVATLAVTLVVSVMTLGKISLNNGKIKMHPWDLPYSYNENGFCLSFVNSYTAYKRNKPENLEYSSKTMNAISEGVAVGAASESINILTDEAVATSSNYIDMADKSNEVMPNIIMVQLEAFCDPLLLGIELNEDPIKNFRSLSEEYSSGNVVVSTFGGGTARSDFESQTGLSMNYLAPGEIPYNTILKEQAVESIGQILKGYDYSTTAIHNYVGNYYQRNSGLATLGFDNYISKEYMTNIEFGEVGWPKDSILLENIKDALTASEKQDYIFTLTVQTHSSYSNHGIENKGISVTNDIDEKYLDEIEYYVNELRETDQFIMDLIDMVNSLDEPTVIAFYSDHLPGLNYINENIEDKYTVQYMIYDNMGLDKEDEDLALYQLSSKVLDAVDIVDGIMPQIHRVYKDNEDYQAILELVQYDILFGKHYYADYKDIYSRTDLQMGVKPITITNVLMEVNSEQEQVVTILGENFVQYSSTVFINEERYESEFIDNNTLVCKIPLDNVVESVEVKQIGQYNAALSSTEKFLIEK